MDLSCVDVEPRLALLLFTDLVDSTELSDRAGHARARNFWAHHDAAGRELIRRWRGVEIGRSDGFLILFDFADDSLGFAIEYHAMLAAGSLPVRSRVGAHWATVTLRRNRPDDIKNGSTPFEVEGLAVPTAARIMAAARAGQTLFSASAAAALEASAPLHERTSHGHWRLKGLAAPVELFEVGVPARLCVPPDDSSKAYRVVRADGLWTPARSLPGTPISELDDFVGRDRDLETLARSIDSGARLLTIFGPGGVGKTRLAQRYARLWRGDFPGGIWFCDLSTAQSVDGIVHAVGQALNVPLGRSDPVSQCGAALFEHGECLVILDNFEQVSQFAASTISPWLQAAPQARFVVTCREVLSIAGERVVPLEPLSVAEASDLFLRRLRASGVVTDADPAVIERLAVLLDCLPLAVELAAARARAIPPEEQLHLIRDRFRLLAVRSGRSTRHATLRATINWSWDLLTAAEQDAMAQLSVFEGGFTNASAAAVVDLPAHGEGIWLPDILQALSEKSLIRRADAQRWTLLRSVREFSAEKLPEGDLRAERRHWEHFARLSETDAVADRCVELDNLVTACKRATAAAASTRGDDPAGMLAAARCLDRSWSALRLTGPFRVALDLALPVLQLDGLPAAARATLHRVAGTASALLGDVDAASRHQEAGIDAATCAGDSMQLSLLLTMKAQLVLQHGRLPEAEALIRQALECAGAEAIPRITALNALGELELARSQPHRAERLFAEALESAQSHRETRWTGGLHGSLGVALMTTGQYAEALPHVEAAARCADSMADRQWASIARCNLGLLLRALGQLDAAADQLNAVVDSAREMAHRRLQTTALCNLGMVELARLRFDAAAEALRAGVTQADLLASTRLGVQCRAYLAQALVGQDDPRTGLKTLDEAEAITGRDCDASLRVLLLAQRALATHAAGEPSTGLEIWREAQFVADGADDIEDESREVLELARITLNPRGR